MKRTGVLVVESVVKQQSLLVKKRKRADRLVDRELSVPGPDFTEREPKRCKFQDVTLSAIVCYKTPGKTARVKKTYIHGSFLTRAEKKELHDRKWKQLQELKECQSRNLTRTEITKRWSTQTKFQYIKLSANGCVKAADQNANDKKTYIPGSFLTQAEKKAIHDRNWKQLQELNELIIGQPNNEISIDSIVSLMQVLNIAGHEEEERKSLAKQKLALEEKEKAIRQRIEKRLWLKKQTELVERSKKELKEVENLLNEMEELLCNNHVNLDHYADVPVEDVISKIDKILGEYGSYKITQTVIDDKNNQSREKKERRSMNSKNDENSPPPTMKPKFKFVPVSFP
ncbi:hypothetical protein DPMN_129996 [Dreissena polymorpha]|uniref:Uncharacterized protein n=1 Tax=Dreissena polymorpha TaxID=45954 RepID=A0A9D4HA50_DREPO|nr:hypothetical protein DPMN_129996 [Dreissena polymorpha]